MINLTTVINNYWYIADWEFRNQVSKETIAHIEFTSPYVELIWLYRDAE